MIYSNLIWISDQECYVDKLARDYRGIKDYTTSEKDCHPWSAHNYTEEDYPGAGLGDHIYCRNPDGREGGAWCFTSDPENEWEYCSVGEKRGTCNNEFGMFDLIFYR